MVPIRGNRAWHDEIVGLSTDDAAIISIGGEWLSILAYSYFVYGWWMVAVQAFNGAGDTLTPTWINVVFFWLIQIPLAWTLALPLGGAHPGVFWGVFVSETAAGVFTLWLFTRGRWKTVKARAGASRRHGSGPGPATPRGSRSADRTSARG